MSNVILIVALTIAIAIAFIFLVLWIYYFTLPPIVPLGDGYTVRPNSDGNEINECGENRDSPCIFAINTLGAAIEQCNILNSICSMFSFDNDSSTMKIIRTDSIFQTPLSNIFIRNHNEQ